MTESNAKIAFSKEAHTVGDSAHITYGRENSFEHPTRFLQKFGLDAIEVDITKDDKEGKRNRAYPNNSLRE